ncbi:hypothetical protein B0H13DRAFT_2331345 [Mycena leptocephala]|nr:hypothetical protein B0H13DRAFT_2331345 [Mycena leptocephala]
MIGTNALLQFSFFVTVSSAAVYAEYPGGSALFSGLTIGIPTVFSGLALIPLTKYDEDSRIIGIRRRTTLASWLVLGQAFGFSVGPFIGGLLSKVGFSNDVSNGYTSPGWVTAAFTPCFAIASMYLFRDLPKQTAPTPTDPTEIDTEQYGFAQLTAPQWGLGIQHPHLHRGGIQLHPLRSGLAAGNFIALGGIATLPFLLPSLRYSPRFQGRTTLATGSAIGLTGLVLALALFAADRVVFG